VSPVRVIDSHTAGEPTRVVIEGGPTLRGGDMAARCDDFRRNHDGFRRAIMHEPRGWDAMVGASLCEPCDARHTAGVLFYNNVDVLGMCGHGAIGVVATLAHLGRIAPGEHHLETPVGVVTAKLHDDGRVSIRNVSSYRLHKDVVVDVDGLGRVVGDVAWGGNWFFLTSWGRSPGLPELRLSNVAALTEYAWRIRRALTREGITGADGAEIDHIELFGSPSSPAADSKNFVLCPGGAYDRSPCGTGTSAKTACLIADGKLQPGQTWRQESIVGGIFEASGERQLPDSGSPRLTDGLEIRPTITGSAFITAETTLLFDERDPFRAGIA
jgi:4-hydroxyproline epimerase